MGAIGKAIVLGLWMAASAAQATYQCGIGDIDAMMGPYWRYASLMRDRQPFALGLTPIKQGRSGIEAGLEGYNATLIKASSLIFIHGIQSSDPNAREPEIYCNSPPYLLPSGQTLDANCEGGNPLKYHKHLDRWVSLGWTELDRPLFGRVAEFNIAPEFGLYQLRSWQAVQPAGPRVASWIWTRDTYTYGACTIRPTLVGFFNGVWNTQQEANTSLALIRRLYGDSRNTIPLEYHLFYNQTGCDSGRNKTAGCLMDLAETYAQRQLELEQEFQHRWEYFWDIAGQREDADTSWLSQLRQRLAASAAPLFAQYRDLADTMRRQARALALNLLDIPSSDTDAAAHLAKLKLAAQGNMNSVLIAHSQGNLFANAAHDAFYRLNLYGMFGPSELRMVHIAPASSTVRGDYVLAHSDLVIAALRMDGHRTVAPNVAAPASIQDPSGHQFAVTYLNAANAAAQRVRQLIATALDSI